MASLKDRLPNRALNGAEVKKIALIEFERMLDSDYAFLPTMAYRRTAFTLSATFHFGEPHPAHELKSRVKPDADGTITGEAPLPDGDGAQSILGKERKVNLDNPNIDRIGHDLPITLQRSTPPKPVAMDNALPGEPTVEMIQHPGVETLEFHYDKIDYPSGTPPVDRDTTIEAAGKLGVPSRKGDLGGSIERKNSRKNSVGSGIDSQIAAGAESSADEAGTDQADADL